MINYYLSKFVRKHDDKYSIHREICELLPGPNDRIYLGNFTDCHNAIYLAEKHYPGQVDGCSKCSNECHERNF